MIRFLRKGLIKLGLILKPKGYSRIKRGYGEGLIWTHEVSDLRYLMGEYEPALASWLMAKMKQGHSFIDIGANAAYFSLLAAKFSSGDKQRIIAVEPMQENLALIEMHIKLNHYPQIVLLPFAVADSDRMVEFSASPNLAANTYNEASSLHKNSPKISVVAKSLDTICNELQLKKFIIKIDVEGAELDVLKGGKKTLESYKPELILATHECHIKGVEQDCLDFLHEIGYTCEPIEDEKFVVGQQDYLCRYKS